MEVAADEVVHALALEHERHLVDGMVDVLLLDDCFEGHVAEHGDLLPELLVERVFAAADEDVRDDADLAQLGHGLLGGLGLQLAGGLDERDIGDVDEEDVLRSDIEGELADGLEERQSLDVARGAADLGDEHVGLGLLAEGVDAALDLVRHMRDDLHGLAEVVAPALFFEDGLVDLAAGEVVEAGQLGVGEALVVAEVEVGLGPVVEHVDLAVLVGAHRARIDIEVRVELLDRHLEPAVFQQGSQCGRRQSLA